MNRSERKKVIKMHKSKKTGRKTLDEALDSYQKKIDSDGEIKDHPSEGIITDMVMRRYVVMKINEEIEDWYLCYPLSCFISSCTRVDLELLIKCIDYSPNHKDLPFLGAWLDHSFYQSEIEYPTFRTQLHKKINNSVNLIAIEQDLKDDFLNKIDTYLEWYEENKVKILLSKEDAPSGFCPFTIFKATCEATKTTIFKYFPQLDTSKKPTNNVKTKEEKFEDVFLPKYK